MDPVSRFVSSPPDVTEDDDHVVVSLRGCDGYAMSFRTARILQQRLGKVIAERDARTADVVPMRKRSHAARS
jgi:hypothetical protein